MYASWLGMDAMSGGFPRGCFAVHVRIQSDVKVKVFWICFSIRIRKRDLLFACTSINALPPSLFDFCNVEIGTLNMEPFHIKYVMAVFICRIMLSGGGGGGGGFGGRGNLKTILRL